MRRDRTALEHMRERQYIVQYLEQEGYPTDGRLFQCPRQDHPDHTPSAHLIPDSNKVKCFGCGQTLDIFDLYSELNGTPASGPGWLQETVKPVAEMFNIPFEVAKISQEQLEQEEQYKIMKTAADFMNNTLMKAVRGEDKSTLLQDAVKEIKRRGWSDSTVSFWNIGAIKSKKSLIEYLEKKFNWQAISTLEFNDANMFRAKNLVFPVTNEWGRIVGFAARKLDFQKKQAICGQCGHTWIETAPKPQQCLRCTSEEVRWDRKYHNTSRYHPLYQKRRLLFGLSHVLPKIREQKHQHTSLVVAEGYTDAITAWDHRINNVCALGSKEFTTEHADLLARLNIRSYAFCLDGDSSGQASMDKHLKNAMDRNTMDGEAKGGTSNPLEMKLKQALDYRNNQIRLIIIPAIEGLAADQRDPDNFIRIMKPDAWHALPQITPFQWILQSQKGQLPTEELIEMALQAIVGEQNIITRTTMIRQLAEITDIVSEKEIKEEVNRRINNKRREVENQVLDRTRKLQHSLDITNDVQQIQQEVRNYTTEVTNLQMEFEGAAGSSERRLQAIDIAQEWCEFEGEMRGLPIGDDMQAFAKTIDGFPNTGDTILLAAPPNVGKSNWLRDLIVRVPEHNPEWTSLYWTLDDSHKKVAPWVVARKVNCPIWAVTRRRYVMDVYPDLAKKISAGWDWFREQMESVRIVDQTLGNSSSLATLEYLVKTAQDETGKNVVAFVDNMAQISDFREMDENRAHRMISAEMKSIATLCDCPIISTVEMNKEGMRIMEQGATVTMNSIRGSAGVLYDADMILFLQNDFDMLNEEDREFTPYAFEHTEAITLNQMAKKRRFPIVRVHIAKNKATSSNGCKGTAYLKMYTDRSLITDLPAEELPMLREKVTNHRSSRSRTTFVPAKKNGQQHLDVDGSNPQPGVN